MPDKVYPAPPKYDPDKVASKIAEKVGEPKQFGHYGVAITNVEKQYLDWKYDEQSKFIVHYERAPDEKLANKVKNKLCSMGMKYLEDDPLGKCNESCNNVFVRNLRSEEISQPVYPEGN